MLSKSDKKEIDRIIKKYKKVFDALAAIDEGTYKRSQVIKTRKQSAAS